MLKVMVVDDEAPARDELKYLLSLEEGVEVIGEADSGPAALGLAALFKPDVIFLDIEMRGMGGMETAAALNTAVPQAAIVFATAYDEYAIKAFEVGALDYILKPFESERIHATINRLKAKQQRAEQAHAVPAKQKVAVHKLPVEKNGKIILINYRDIIYAYAQAGEVTIVTANDEYSYGGTLTELEERLHGTSLLRVHKSYLVNMSKVAEVVPWFKGTYWLKLEGRPEAEIPVSKQQIKEIKDILGLK